MKNIYIFHGKCSMNGPSKALIGLSSALSTSVRLIILTFEYSNEFYEALNSNHKLKKIKKPILSIPKIHFFPYFWKLNYSVIDENIRLLILWTPSLWNQKFIRQIFNNEKIHLSVMIHNNPEYSSGAKKAIMNSIFKSRLFCGQDIFEIAIKKFPQIKNNSYVISNTIDKALVAKYIDKCVYDFHYPDIVAISGIRIQKNLETLVNAVSMLEKENNFNTLIVGPPGNDSKNILKIINEKNIKSIDMMGPVSNPYCLLKNSKIYVNTSIYEGLSISVLEAVFLKKPMILSNCSANREIIQACPYAFGFEVGDHIELSLLIKQILINPPSISEEDYNKAMGYISHEKIRIQFNSFIKGIV